MENIITERFQYARITPFKDYCRLDEKKRLTNSINDNLENLDSWDNIKEKFNFGNKIPHGRLVSLPERKKKKVFYASTTEEIREQFQLDYFKTPHISIETTKDRHIKSHFGRPLSEITITTLERSIIKNGDKVTIKLYLQNKHRGFNCIYFKESKVVKSITFNIVTGNFTTLMKFKKGKQPQLNFRTNSFNTVFQMIMGDNSFITLGEKTGTIIHPIVVDEYKNSFNNELFTTKIQELLGIDSISRVPYSTNPQTFLNDIMNFFVKRKKIKVMDGNYDYLLTKYYPTEKFLKKNDRKLVASVLDMLGIKTKLTIKILHTYPNIDICGLYKFISYFDNDFTKYIGNLNPSIFEKLTRSPDIYSYSDPISFMIKEKNEPYKLLNVEKENLIRITNSKADNNSNGILSANLFQLFDDHFRMIKRIREFDPSIHLKAKTEQEFNIEHRELSKIISVINKGWVIEYLYDEKVLSDLERPLNCLKDENSLHVLYPCVLKREEDYKEEGSFMHHCVASYSDKDKSIIISLRTESGMDRVTCEFDIQSGRCLQQRSFCNAYPPSYFEDGLLLLSQKVEQYSRWGTLNWKEKKKVPVKVNGIEIMQELPVVRVTDIFNDVMLPF